MIPEPRVIHSRTSTLQKVKQHTQCLSTVLLKHSIEIDVMIELHGFRHGSVLVWFENVRQIQNGTGVAAVHQGHHVDTFGERFDQNVEQVIVSQHASLLEINRYQGFVVPILFVTACVYQLRAVTRVMQVNSIVLFAIRHNLFVRSNYVLQGGFYVFSVIHQDCDVFFFESVDVHDIVCHVQHVVVTTRQLAVLSYVVDSDHDGTADAGRRAGNEIEIRVHVDLVQGGQLRDLAVALAAEILPHLFEDLREAHRVVGGRLVLVEDPQQGRGAGAPRTSGRIGQLKAIDVGNVRGGLRVFAPGYHPDVLVAHRVGLLGLEGFPLFFQGLLAVFFATADMRGDMVLDLVLDPFADLF
mmetsp:Transcript_13626/g.31945  ORF Transcript_13626/g.31945 Transcript_13626/m.31945 type:complete len:355 (-) Transcript_13626:67-1131(-)